MVEFEPIITSLAKNEVEFVIIGGLVHHSLWIRLCNARF